MRNSFDVLIIGLGPAGMMATYTLSKSGYRVLAVDQGKPYLMRNLNNPFDVANGFGGAGLFSDGKLSFYPSASNLWSNLDRERLRCAYQTLFEEFQRIGYKIPEWDDKWTNNKRSVDDNAVKKYNSIYIDRSTRSRIILNTYQQIKESVLLQHRIDKISKDSNGAYVVELADISNQPIYANNVVVATGKAGNGLFLSTNGISLLTRTQYEVGFRIETAKDNFIPYYEEQGDYKIIESIYDDLEFRTFCCCKDGRVLKSESFNYFSFNGSILDHRTGRANIGLVIRAKRTGGLIAKEIESCIKKKECFRYGLDRNFDSSSSILIGENTDRLIFERLRKVIKSYDKQFNTVIYGPEIEYFGEYPIFEWKTLRLENENIWIAGDISAGFRGLVAALVSGIYAANSIMLS